MRVPAVHFAVEVDNWEATLANLDALSVPYSRGGARRLETTSDADPRYGLRDDTEQYYTYIHDPDGNMIELVYHPLGLEDSKGQRVEVVYDPQGLRWRQLPGSVSQARVEG
jgi:hypothetical protein